MKIMTIVKIVSFFASLVFLGYGIAFIGSELSWWIKPEPDTAIVSLAFVCAGAFGLAFAFNDLAKFIEKRL